MALVPSDRSSARYALGVAVLVGVVGVFAVLRATHEYRWSAWALGDAQNLNAALHFAREGFRTHYFLPYFHPGYLGQVVGTASYLGYYTHYPPLFVIFNGVVATLFDENLFVLKSVSILVSMAALACWYLVASRLFARPVAFLSTLFVGTSVAFLEYVDSLTNMPGDEFLRAAALLLFLSADQPPRRAAGKRTAVLAATWIVVFLQSFNSFDYIIFLQVFFWGYYLLTRGPHALPYARLLLLATAPAAGFLVHFAQNAAALGVGEAYRDLAGIFWHRTLDLRAVSIFELPRLVWGYFRINFPHVSSSLQSGYGFDVSALLLLAVVVLLLRPDHAASQRAGALDVNRALLLLAVCSVTFWMFLMGRVFPYMHLHALPIVGSLFGLTVICCWRLLREPSAGIRRWAGIIGLVACLLPALDRLSYVRAYPNLLDPSRVWLMDVPREEMIAGLEVSKKIRDRTRYGDIVMVPFRGLLDWHGGQEVNALYEYYSQRRNEAIGWNVGEFQDRRAFLESYRTKLRSEQGVEIKLYAVVQVDAGPDDERARLYEYLTTAYRREALGERWLLVHLDEPIADHANRQGL